MDIILIGHGYKYELEQTAIMLLPGLEPRVAAGINNGGCYAVSTMSENSAGVTVETVIFHGAERYQSVDSAARNGADERQWIKVKKQLVS